MPRTSAGDWTAAGVSPLEPALGATLGASMGFMMPISTPPNAIVYSSGYIPIGTMMRYGIVLDIVGYFVDHNPDDRYKLPKIEG